MQALMAVKASAVAGGDSRRGRFLRPSFGRIVGSSCFPLCVSMALHGGLLFASAFIVFAARPRRERVWDSPLTITLAPPEPRPLFKLPKEVEPPEMPEPGCIVDPPFEEVDTSRLEAPPETSEADVPEFQPPPIPEEVVVMPSDTARHLQPPPQRDESHPAEPVESVNRPPRYPLLARRLGHEGRVVLELKILADGSTGEVTVVESSGHRILDGAAVRAAREWRFIPAERGGAAIVARVRIPVRFVLERTRRQVRLIDRRSAR